MNIRPYLERDQDAVIVLWERCGLLRPWNDPKKDIARKLRVQRDLFLVGTTGAAAHTAAGAAASDTIVGSVMAGYEGHRGWINYLAVDPQLRRAGLGRALMEEAERRLRALGCAKINLQIRKDNAEATAFYAGIGFTEDQSLSFGKRLESDAAP
ncbi:MAG: GNAT family acetyltransferase [Betaproteobacteria bacterium]|nr:GNAT family acetyltransferase [Betaproteobacteria bacterium]